MEHVMVPVPEEHVETVTRYLQKLAQGPAPTAPWPPDAIEQFVSGLDEPSQSLLLLAAEASIGRMVLTIRSAAERVGCSTNEVLGMTVALNDAVLAAGGPWFLLAAMPSSSESGSRSWSLHMSDAEVAQAVLEVGRGVGRQA